MKKHSFKFNYAFSVAFAFIMFAVLSVFLFLLGQSNNNRIESQNDRKPYSGSVISANSFPDNTQSVSSNQPDEYDSTGDADSDDKDTPPSSENKVISFLAAGDNLIHQNMLDYAKTLAALHGTNSEYYFEPMYDNISSIISSADIAFVNQEVPIAGSELRGFSGYPTFNSPDDAGAAIVNIGFDIVNIANNHMLDRGEKGYQNTINFWKNQPVTLIGGYTSKNDFDTVRYIEYDGVKIALLAYTYGTNGIYLPQNSSMWVPYYFEDDCVRRHVTEARSNADIVIVSMHWGNEHSFTPSKIQQEYCDLIVSCNADVIIGTHPHVLQPIEWKERPDGKKTLVAYSVGNLLSSMRFPKNMVGGLLTFDIDYSDSENIYISNPQIIPTMCYYSTSKDSVAVYKFTDFPVELYSSHGALLNEKTSFEELISCITNTISQEYLPSEFIEKFIFT